MIEVEEEQLLHFAMWHMWYHNVRGRACHAEKLRITHCSLVACSSASWKSQQRRRHRWRGRQRSHPRSWGWEYLTITKYWIPNKKCQISILNSKYQIWNTLAKEFQTLGVSGEFGPMLARRREVPKDSFFSLISEKGWQWCWRSLRWYLIITVTKKRKSATILLLHQKPH